MNSKGDVHCSYINDSVHTSFWYDKKLPANTSIFDSIIIVFDLIYSPNLFDFYIPKLVITISAKNIPSKILENGTKLIRLCFKSKLMNHFHLYDFSLGTYLVDEIQICKQVVFDGSKYDKC